MRKLIALMVVAALSTVSARAEFSVTTSGPLTVGPGAPNNAVPYPLPITVSGLGGGGISSMSLTLNGFTHSWPDDLTMLLVAPNGTTGMIVFDGGINGLAGGITNGTYTFVNGGAVWPNNSSSTQPADGNYQPISYFNGTVMPAPAPAIPGANPDVPGPYSFDVFNGLNPNGTWNVYLRDFFTGDGGSITSISLNITTTPAPPAVFAFAIGTVALAGLRRVRNKA